MCENTFRYKNQRKGGGGMLKDILNNTLQEVEFDENVLAFLETELAAAGCGTSDANGSCSGWCETAKG